jgi:adenine-specific DNA methylase
LILRATVEWPQRHGLEVLDSFQRIGREFVVRVRDRLHGVFPEERKPGTRPDGYLWARTITCPYCDGLIPLSPNWRLAPDGTGVRLIPDEKSKRCRFEIVRSVEDQSQGTLARGDAQCPFPGCGRVVDQEQVRQRSRDGVMGEQLYAVVFKARIESKTKTGKTREKWERGYRAPRDEDDNTKAILAALEEKKHEWEALAILPTEEVGPQHPKYRLDRYGIVRWTEVFFPRQLLCHGTSVEVFRELLDEEQAKGKLDEATKAAFVYLSLALDKLRDYNSRMTRWHSNREVMVNTFDRHDFAFKWSYAEMAPLIVGLGYDWAIEQVGKCIGELITLARPDIGRPSKKTPKQQATLFPGGTSYNPPPVVVTCTSGDNLDYIASGSVDAVVMDPPYYDNVMYAELSDFFYVWLKRTAGHVYPEWFTRKLTDKENEAVANPAKFDGQRGAQALAGKDYQQRMAAIFAECRRVLKDDGILTLMFTHKATGAWDALTSGLMEAGFTITASWPINTEAEGSLHIKEKAAANSTIFLVCRPRPPRKEEGRDYWEDVEPLVAKAVRARVKTYQECGIRGVDLYLSCFGPALEEFAKHWPLTRGSPRVQVAKKKRKAGPDEVLDPYAVTPEDALDAARREVKAWRMEQLLRTTRKAELDGLTEWFVLAWDAFRAPQFPYDEALRLARVVGLDMDRDVIGHLAEKKASEVILWESEKRAAKGALGPADGSRAMIDALHHATQRVRTVGLEAGREVLEKSGAVKAPTFTTALAAVLEVLPVSSTFTHYEEEKGPVAEAAKDFDALENLRRLAFSDRVKEPEQLKLWAEEK